MELTTVEELIEALKTFDPETKIYVGGTYGYLNIVEDENGEQAVCFDDEILEEDYEDDEDTMEFEVKGYCVSFIRGENILDEETYDCYIGKSEDRTKWAFLINIRSRFKEDFSKIADANIDSFIRAYKKEFGEEK